MPAYKQMLNELRYSESVLTKSFSGRWARSLQNKFIIEVEKSGLEIPEYPIQGSLTLPTRIEAQLHNNRKFTSIWAGEYKAISARVLIADILIKLIEQTEAVE